MVFRRGRACRPSALAAVAATLAVVALDAPGPAPNRTPLATGPGWRVDGASSIEGGASLRAPACPGTDRAWLSAGVLPGPGTRGRRWSGSR